MIEIGYCTVFENEETLFVEIDQQDLLINSYSLVYIRLMIINHYGRPKN